MFAKLVTVFGLLAVSAQVAVAAPPACMLAAVNTQDDPSDMKAVCSTGAPQVKKYMSSNCGDNLDAATSAFQSYCKDAGVTVSASGYATSSSSASATGSASASSSGTAKITSAPYPVGTGSVPYGTAASSGFMTATTNGTYSAPSASTGSATGSSGSSPAKPTESSVTSSTGGAARLGMDIVGLAALGVFGAMLAL